MSDNITSFDVYFLDSSCSFTIIGNSSVVYDVHDIPPRTIEGLTGSRILDKGCTLRVCVPNAFGNAHEMVLNNAGYCALFLPDEDSESSGLITPPQHWLDGHLTILPVVQRNNVFLLTPMDFDTLHQRSETPKFAFPAVSKLSHLMYEEVLHSRFHCPLELLASMAGKVRCMPCPVRVARATKVNCAHCNEANAVRQDYPTASDSRLTAETELWQWDMLENGRELCHHQRQPLRYHLPGQTYAFLDGFLARFQDRSNDSWLDVQRAR
eukprot:1182-Rhodomonas_salina.2